MRRLSERAITMIALLLLPGVQLASAQTTITLTLGEAARLAARRGAEPAAAQQRVSAARGQLTSARADLLPVLSGAAGLSERTFNSAGLGITLRDPATGGEVLPPGGAVLGPVRAWDARVTARWNVLDPAALARAGAAGGMVRVAQAAALDVSHQAAAAAALDYIRVLRAEGHIGALATDSTLAEDLLDIAHDQRNAGLGTALDEARARTQLSATRAELIDARAERERALLDLRQSMGIALDAPLALADSLPTTASLDPESTEEEATARSLRQRGDLLALEAESDVARRQITSIRAERLATVSIFGDYGGAGSSTSRLLGTYSWGVALSVPVFDGLRREGRIAEQRSALREIDVRRRDLNGQITLEIRTSLLDLSAAREQMTASEDRVAFAREALAQARDRLTAGIAGNSEVVTALVAVNAALSAWVDARAAYQSARVSLARAQGAITEIP